MKKIENNDAKVEISQLWLTLIKHKCNNCFKETSDCTHFLKKISNKNNDFHRNIHSLMDHVLLFFYVFLLNVPYVIFIQFQLMNH